MSRLKRQSCARFFLAFFLLLIIAIFIAISSWFYASYSRGLNDSLRQEAVQNLSIGMERANAEVHLISATTHQQCLYENISIDIYVWGNKDSKTASALVLRYQIDTPQDILIDIAYLDYYMLQSGHYAGCELLP